MSSRTRVHTDQAPAAIGPYSQAIVAGGLVHCSGQCAFDPVSGELCGADAPAQAELALRNLAAVLEAAGASLEGVVKCNVYLADMAAFGAVNAVYERFFPGEAPPARACIQAGGLPKGALVEIDCVALLD